MDLSPQKVVLPQDSQPTSLVIRGLLAILLTIGFYGLALAVAGALLGVIYFEVVAVRRINIRITLMCLIAALTILWSIMPRIDFFKAPGAPLLPTDHPRLFDAIQSVARQVGQKMPAEVYLIPDVNAFVHERGGFMGLGRKRVMGIGLPLFQTLTVQQMQSVLAHEFGHFYSGDTRLGPWIYSTRSAIIRTVSSLGNSLLQAPFRWYGNMFLRITQSISRRQEYVADALSASVSGKQAVIDTLKRIHSVAPAYNAYWQNEVVPIFNHGYRPPIAAGFSQFLAVKSVHDAVDNVLNDALKESKSDPFDSHPALAERIQAISALPMATQPPNNEAPAQSLLNHVGVMEVAMLQVLIGKNKIDPLKPVTWEETGETVYLASWEAMIKNYHLPLTGLMATNLLTFHQIPNPLSAALLTGAGNSPSHDVLQTQVDQLVCLAFADIMARSGWKAITSPGCTIVMVKDGMEVEPFTLVSQLFRGEIKEEDWAAICKQYGIDGVML